MSERPSQEASVAGEQGTRERERNRRDWKGHEEPDCVKLAELFQGLTVPRQVEQKALAGL